MDAVRLMGEIVKETAEADQGSRIPWAAPNWWYSAMHRMITHSWQALSTVLPKADAIINVGVSGPGVVKTALEKVRGENFEVLCETIKKTAFKITRVGQLVAQEASKRLECSIWYH